MGVYHKNHKFPIKKETLSLFYRTKSPSHLYLASVQESRLPSQTGTENLLPPSFNYENRASGMSYDITADRTHEQPFQRSQATASHDDQIGFIFFGNR